MAIDILNLCFQLGLDFISFRLSFCLIELPAEISNSGYPLFQLVDVFFNIIAVLVARYVL